MLAQADLLTSHGPILGAWSLRNVYHTKGRWRGQPLAYEDWQQRFLDEALAIDPLTGLRVWSEVLLLIPRKTGKSTMAGALGLYLVTMDGYERPWDGRWMPEWSPEVYVAAGSVLQAGAIFNQEKKFVEHSPSLSDVILARQYHLEVPENDGILRVVSSEAPLQHGLNPSGNLIDELHAHKDDDLYTALTTGGGAREQPFTMIISTEGADDEGPLAVMVDKALALADREEVSPFLTICRDRTAGFLAYIYRPPEGADPDDRDVWRGVNPASWLQDLRYLERQRAKPTMRLSEFMRWHLNMRTPTEQPWLPPGTWPKLRHPAMVAISKRANLVTGSGTIPEPVMLAKLALLDPDLPIGVGIDVGQNHDSTGVVVAQRQRVDGRDYVVLIARPWVNPWPVNHPSYDLWRPNQEEIRAYLRMLRGRFLTAAASKEYGRAYHKRVRPAPGPAFAYDPWHFSESAEILEAEGLNMVEFPQQAVRMVPATELFYGLATTGRIMHDDDATLSRHIGNAVAVLTPRGYKIAKGKVATKRVDLAVASAMSVVFAMAEPPRPKERKQRVGKGF